jgi:hypothetical protein
MPDLPGRHAPALDPELEGIPLSLYAAVQAYLGGGLALEPSLDHAGLSPASWPAIEQAWITRLSESAADDGALIAACDEHRLAALAHVERRLPPLDEDLAAWLDFFRAFSASEDPGAFLGERGMIEGDVFLLLDLWQPRLVGDPAVRDRATALLGSAPGPVPAVRPALPRLRPETRWPRRSAEPPAAPAPGEAKAPSLATTGVAMPDLSKLPLPFARQKSGDPPPAAAIPGPVIQAKRGLGDTAPVFAAPARPVVPFAGARGSEPPQAPLAPPPAPEPTAAASPPIAPPPVAVPTRSPLAGTSLDVRVSAAPVLPFAPGAPAIVAAPTIAAPAAPRPGLGDTAPVVAPSAPALPFTIETRLDLQAYAMMQAEITADRAGAMATITRYGLTPEGKRAEDSAWKAKLANDPALRMAWVKALAEAGERLRSRR